MCHHQLQVEVLHSSFMHASSCFPLSSHTPQKRHPGEPGQFWEPHDLDRPIAGRRRRRRRGHRIRSSGDGPAEVVV